MVVYDRLYFMEHLESRITTIIKELRLLHGYTQSFVAQSLHIPLRTYQSWEKEFSSHIGNLELLAKLYRISLIDISHLATMGEQECLDSIQRWPFESEACLDAIFIGASAHDLKASFPALVSSDKTFETSVDNLVRDAYFSGKLESRLSCMKCDTDLEESIAVRFGLMPNAVKVVDTTLVQFQIVKEMALGVVGSRWLTEMASQYDRFSVGVSNGYTIARIMDHLKRGNATNFQLFPLNFTMTPADFSITATSLISSFRYKNEGRCSDSNPITEPEVYSAMQLADAVVMGIGTFSRKGLYSNMIQATLGSTRLQEIIAGGAVGDLNYYLLDEKGDIIQFPDLVSEMGAVSHSALIKAIHLDVIKKKANHGCKVIIAAAGAHKASLVSLAITKRYANHLLIDSSLARVLEGA